jgi:hypothetical protein
LKAGHARATEWTAERNNQNNENSCSHI